MTAGPWSLRIVAPCEFITANGSYHRYVRSRLVREWRNAAFASARADKLPTGLVRVRIDVVFRFRGPAPVRDRDNLRPTFKAVVDGLGPSRHFSRNGTRHHSKGYGLIPDDSDKHLEPGSFDIGEPIPNRGYGPAGELHLTITEVLP